MIRIRTATLEDLPGIKSFDEFFGDRAEEIRRGECHVAVDADGAVVGYATFNHALYNRPFLAFLRVRGESRRQGTGTALMAHVEGLAEPPRLFTSTELDNLPMQRLLHRRGYVLCGTIEHVNLSGVPELMYSKLLPGSA